jgi:hypothetical protein
MRAIMRRVTMISPGLRSMSPRGRRGFSLFAFWEFMTARDAVGAGFKPALSPRAGNFEYQCLTMLGPSGPISQRKIAERGRVLNPPLHRFSFKIRAKLLTRMRLRHYAN